jgi:hypothetical protein
LKHHESHLEQYNPANPIRDFSVTVSFRKLIISLLHNTRHQFSTLLKKLWIAHLLKVNWGSVLSAGFSIAIFTEFLTISVNIVSWRMIQETAFKLGIITAVQMAPSAEPAEGVPVGAVSAQTPDVAGKTVGAVIECVAETASLLSDDMPGDFIAYGIAVPVKFAADRLEGTGGF